jgi:hypothetical protein
MASLRGRRRGGGWVPKICHLCDHGKDAAAQRRQGAEWGAACLQAANPVTKRAQSTPSRRRAPLTRRRPWRRSPPPWCARWRTGPSPGGGGVGRGPGGGEKGWRVKGVWNDDAVGRVRRRITAGPRHSRARGRAGAQPTGGASGEQGARMSQGRSQTHVAPLAPRAGGRAARLDALADALGAVGGVVGGALDLAAGVLGGALGVVGWSRGRAARGPAGGEGVERSLAGRYARGCWGWGPRAELLGLCSAGRASDARRVGACAARGQAPKGDHSARRGAARPRRVATLSPASDARSCRLRPAESALLETSSAARPACGVGGQVRRAAWIGRRSYPDASLAPDAPPGWAQGERPQRAPKPRTASLVRSPARSRSRLASSAALERARTPPRSGAATGAGRGARARPAAPVEARRRVARKAMAGAASCARRGGTGGAGRLAARGASGRAGAGGRRGRSDDLAPGRRRRALVCCSSGKTGAVD